MNEPNADKYSQYHRKISTTLATLNDECGEFGTHDTFSQRGEIFLLIFLKSKPQHALDKFNAFLPINFISVKWHTIPTLFHRYKHDEKENYLSHEILMPPGQVPCTVCLAAPATIIERRELFR